MNRRFPQRVQADNVWRKVKKDFIRGSFESTECPPPSVMGSWEVRTGNREGHRPSSIRAHRTPADELSSALVALATACLMASCAPAGTGADEIVTSRGTVEVTARLVEIPEGAIFKRDLYDYATILKYEVIKIHRGQPQGHTLYVGHYNPWKSRTEAADRRVRDVGGNLRQFRPGQIHRLALEVPIEDHFMGGIVNQYFGRETGPLYWAVWTNLAGQ